MGNEISRPLHHDPPPPPPYPSPSPPPPPPDSASSHFPSDAEVEVRSFKSTLRGAWHPATVVRPSSHRSGMIFVEFRFLTRNKDSSIEVPLRDAVDPSLIRPKPPDDGELDVFEWMDAVDVFDEKEKCWWEGVVETVRKKETVRVYEVRGLESGDLVEVEGGGNQVRKHLEWVNEDWVEMPPWDREPSLLERAIAGRDIWERARWERPSKEIYKLNSTAAKRNGLIYGLGFVVRDSEGKVLACGHKRLQLQQDDVGLAKLKAALFGLEETEKSGFMNIVLETDSLMVIDDIKSKRHEKSRDFVLVGKIHDIAKRLTTFYLSCVSGEANRAARYMAHKGSSLRKEAIWKLQDHPPGLSRILVNDVPPRNRSIPD